MNKLDFWSDWEAPYRLIFQVLAGLLLLMMGGMLVLEIGELSYFYDWDLTAYLQEMFYPVFSNHSKFLESTVNTEISFLLQKVSGGFQLLPEWLVYLYLVVLYLSITGLLTIATYLSRFWFIVCSGLLVLLIAGTGIGRIGILGLQEEYAVGFVSLCFIVLGYYFNSIDEDRPMGYRFLAFLGSMCTIGILIYFTSGGENPLLHLTYFSYWPALALTVLFVLVIGHEIVYAILILTTQGKRDKENTKHFIALTVVYLLNVGLVYLRNFGYLDWDFYYVNVFFLLVISAVLGFWGLKGREVLYGNSLPFYPYAVFLYLSLAFISISTILMFFISGNDSSIEVVEDAIVFGHLAFGGMFFIYILVNFVSLMVKGLPVYKVAFKEDNFPYATSRIGGMVVVAAFFFASNNAPLYQAVSGYFNGLGDMNQMLGDKERAQAYYDLGSKYGNVLLMSNGNHKSNYMLGALEEDPVKATAHYRNSIKRKPTQYAYASLGYSYEEDNRFFEALFVYQEGLKKFPDSWALKNNLALLYNRTDVIDSVLYYIQNDNMGAWNEEVMAANLVAISAMRKLSLDEFIDIDQILSSQRLGLRNNFLGYQISQGIAPDLESILQLESNRLHLYTYSYYKNLGLACLTSENDSYLKIADQLIGEPYNGEFRENLQFVQGLNMYKQGQVTEAFNLLKILRDESLEDNGRINGLLGKWSMELGFPFLASKYFELARESGFPGSSADLSQAYSAIDNSSVGKFILQKELDDLDSTQLYLAGRLENLISALDSDEVIWSDGYSYQREEKALKTLLETKNDTSSTSSSGYESLTMSNPFFEKGVLAAVEYFNEIKKDENAAYNILVNGIAINQYSEILIKAYIDQCFRLGLVNYAEDTILRLYEIMSQDEFQAYELEFEQKKSQAQAVFDNW